MINELAKQRCVPCKGGVLPLTYQEIEPLLQQINGWQVIENHHLKKTKTFKDFVSALAFVNEIGKIAEAEGHHPDINLSWGRVTISIFTHKIDGLSKSFCAQTVPVIKSKTIYLRIF